MNEGGDEQCKGKDTMHLQHFNNSRTKFLARKSKWMLSGS